MKNIIVLVLGSLLLVAFACAGLAAISPAAGEAIEARSDQAREEAEAERAAAEAERAEYDAAAAAAEAAKTEAEVELAEAEAQVEQAKADQERAAGERAEANADAYATRELARAAARALRLQGRLLSWLTLQQSAVLGVLLVTVIAVVVAFLLPRVRMWWKIHHINYGG